MNADETPIQTTDEPAQPQPGRFNLVMFRARRPQDYRCKGCGRLLGRFIFTPGLYANVKCPRCGLQNIEDIALNSTSAVVLVELLDRLNGHTPEIVVAAAARLLERVTPALDEVLTRGVNTPPRNRS